MIKLGGTVILPCGANLEITQLMSQGELPSKKGLIGVTIRVDDPYSGAIATDSGSQRELSDVTLNFFGQNILALIATLERLEEAVCPRK